MLILYQIGATILVSVLFLVYCWFLGAGKHLKRLAVACRQLQAWWRDRPLSVEDCMYLGLTDYEIINDGQAIRLPCNKISYHPEDAKQRYCARCKRFLDAEKWRKQLKGPKR